MRLLIMISILNLTFNMSAGLCPYHVTSYVCIRIYAYTFSKMISTISICSKIGGDKTFSPMYSINFCSDFCSDFSVMQIYKFKS